jgi:hypothetical protein
VIRLSLAFAFTTIILFNLIAQETPKLDSNIVEFDPGKPIYFLDDEIDENSGLIFYENLFWTLNDSDGEPIIYAFNTLNGELKKRIRISNAINVDWEDLCHDENYIYVGDFGSNAGNRRDLKFYRIPKGLIKDEDYQELKADIINFSYEDQEDFIPRFRTTDYDCEATICLDSGLYIFTKDWIKEETKLYQIPKTPGTYEAKLISSFNIDGLVTAAGTSPDKRFLAILGYKDYMPFMWVFSDYENQNFFNGEKLRIEMPAIHQAQTEALVFKTNDSLFISCEKSIEKSLILFTNVVFPQQMFFVPVSFWEEYFSSNLMDKNKNSLRISND